jgi:hypothetical protein
MREFDTGATRNEDGDKLDYEGFLAPEVLQAYAMYMHGHRQQDDGSIRDADNWQKGIPIKQYMKSLVRHTLDLWAMHRGAQRFDEKGQPFTKLKLCMAILFNAMGYAFELLKLESSEGRAVVLWLKRMLLDPEESEDE